MVDWGGVGDLFQCATMAIIFQQVISKVSQRATVQSGASHKTTGATTEIRPIKSSKRTAQVGDAPPKKVTKYSSTLPSTSTKKKGEKRG